MLKKALRVPVDKFPRNAETIFRGEYISIKQARNSVGHDRVGVVVSKKTANKSTARSYIRRQLFAFFEKHHKLIQARTATGVDYAIFARKSFSRTDAAGKMSAEKEVESAVKRNKK